MKIIEFNLIIMSKIKIFCSKPIKIESVLYLEIGPIFAYATLKHYSFNLHVDDGCY